MILKVCLIDKSLSLGVYKSYSLPIVHPNLFAFKYKLENKYIVITKANNHVTLPSLETVLLCQATKGHLCQFNTALYPTEPVKCCIYALFVNDDKKIKANCKLSLEPQLRNLVFNLKQNLWLISAIASETLQIHCLLHTKYQQINPSFQIVNTPNGCEVYSPAILILANMELLLTNSSLDLSQEFVDFNQTHISLTDLKLINNFK